MPLIVGGVVSLGELICLTENPHGATVTSLRTFPKGPSGNEAGVEDPDKHRLKKTTTLDLKITVVSRVNLP